MRRFAAILVAGCIGASMPLAQAQPGDAPSQPADAAVAVVCAARTQSTGLFAGSSDKRPIRNIGLAGRTPMPVYAIENLRLQIELDGSRYWIEPWGVKWKRRETIVVTEAGSPTYGSRTFAELHREACKEP